jgi:hypothetical protein
MNPRTLASSAAVPVEIPAAVMVGTWNTRSVLAAIEERKAPTVNKRSCELPSMSRRDVIKAGGFAVRASFTWHSEAATKNEIKVSAAGKRTAVSHP